MKKTQVIKTYICNYCVTPTFSDEKVQNNHEYLRNFPQKRINFEILKIILLKINHNFFR